MPVKKGKPSGFVLLAVVMALTMAGLIAYIINHSAGIQIRLATSRTDLEKTRYAAEAGIAHTRWLLNQGGSCMNYAGLQQYPFGSYRYSSFISPLHGSPVSITASATSSGGAAFTLTQENITVFSSDNCSFVAQYGPMAGIDTTIREGDLRANFGNDTQLVTHSEMFGDGLSRGLLRFDLGNIPAKSVIVSAELRLFLASAGSGSEIVRLHRLLRPWAEGDGTAGSGVDWLTSDGVQSWSQPGGDYDPFVSASFIASGTGWKSMNVKNLVQGWVDGVNPNYGMMLLSLPSPGGSEKRYFSSDSPFCSQRPLLSVTFRCECGVLTALGCNASFEPSSLMDQIFIGSMGATDLKGLAYLPACKTFNDFISPEQGAWLLTDAGTGELLVVDMAGLLITKKTLPGSTRPLGATFIKSGTYTDHFAFIDASGNTIAIVDHQAALRHTISTVSLSTSPTGIAFIDSPAFSLHVNHLAMVCNSDASGTNMGAIHILDQLGIPRASINISTATRNPTGIAHLPGSDKFLVSDAGGMVYLIDFKGNIVGRYSSTSFGAASPSGMAVYPPTCAHVLHDKAVSSLFVLK